MGFNISGIAIDKSYENDLDRLQQDLGLTLHYVEDVNFETASANWTEEGSCFVYFSKGSTLLFLNMELCIEPYTIKGAKTLSFALSEISMTFCLNYCEGSEVIRHVMEAEGRKMAESGAPFDFEGDIQDASEIIWRKLDDVLDVSFNSIDLGAIAKKYNVSFGAPQLETAQSEKREHAAVPLERVTEKPWWKFW